MYLCAPPFFSLVYHFLLFIIIIVYFAQLARCSICFIQLFFLAVFGFCSCCLANWCLDTWVVLFLARALENAWVCMCLLLLFISHESMINGNCCVQFSLPPPLSPLPSSSSSLSMSCYISRMVLMLLLLNDNNQTFCCCCFFFFFFYIYISIFGCCFGFLFGQPKYLWASERSEHSKRTHTVTLLHRLLLLFVGDVVQHFNIAAHIYILLCIGGGASIDVGCCWCYCFCLIPCHCYCCCWFFLLFLKSFLLFNSSSYLYFGSCCCCRSSLVCASVCHVFQTLAHAHTRNLCVICDLVFHHWFSPVYVRIEQMNERTVEWTKYASHTIQYIFHHRIQNMANFSELIFGKLKNGFIRCVGFLVNFSLSFLFLLLFSQCALTRGGGGGGGVDGMDGVDGGFWFLFVHFTTEISHTTLLQYRTYRITHTMYCWMWFQWKVLRNLWFNHSPEECESLLMRLLLLLSLLMPMSMLLWLMKIFASINTKHFWQWSFSVRTYVCVCVFIVWFVMFVFPLSILIPSYAERVSNEDKKVRAKENPTHAHIHLPRIATLTWIIYHIHTLIYLAWVLVFIMLFIITMLSIP